MVSETSNTETINEPLVGPEMQRLGISLEQLKIQFSTSGEMKLFNTLFSGIHEKLNLPIGLPIVETSPSFQDSFQDHFRETRSTFGNTSDAEMFSPGTSPGTISTYAASFATSNASFTPAPSFTTSVPSEYSQRASSMFHGNSGSSASHFNPQ